MDRALKTIALAGTGALLVAIVLTVADIALRSVSDLTVFGVIDIVQLCVLVSAMLAIPCGFMRGAHVSVDVVYARLPLAVQKWLDVFSLCLSALFLGGVFWFSTRQMLTEIEFGDRSMTLGISTVWYWLPFLIGIGLAVAANLGMTVQAMRRPAERDAA